MRLLNTSSYEVREFLYQIPPAYAILSHTWEQDEVLLQDMVKGRDHASKRKGFAKIEGCCRQALEDGYSWVWIDTCCIDKTSTAELHEAVNSMYSWYQGAGVCYAYLADVPRFSFMDSRWFERGWTLQELIAPRYVEFYAADWSELGTKSSLEPAICAITGISADVLKGRSPLTCTVAERMSWAAGRRTTRLEDEAYCLLGIFDINMSLLYGEGTRAFTRLQEEIIKQSEDLSLLAWSPWVERSVLSMDGSPPATGALAPNPSVFKRPDLTSYLPSTAFDFDDAESLLLADMGSMDWRDLHPHQWGSNLELLPLHQFLFEPPTTTSRGICATLMVDFGEFEDDVSHHRGADTEAGAMVDVLAWIYIDVVTKSNPTSRAVSRNSRHSRNTSSRSSRPQSMTERAMMVCIWLSLPRTEVAGSLNIPIRAVRIPDRAPVCVPMIFLNRFQPRKVYLQYAPDRPMPAPLGWAASRSSFSGRVQTEETSKRIKLKFRGTTATTTNPLRAEIVSHYPPHTALRPPGSVATMDGSLRVAAGNDSFDVMIAGCQPMEASAVLRCALTGGTGTTPGINDDQFVLVIGPPRLGEGLNCHVEKLDASLVPMKGQDFWHHFFATQNRHTELEDPQMPPTDRSSTQLPCGIAITTSIKKRIVQGANEFLPTLVVTVVQQQSREQVERPKEHAAKRVSPRQSGFITHPVAPPTYLSSPTRDARDMTWLAG